MPRYYVGTSGWMYRHWKGVFYPPALPSREWLSFYMRTFRTTEINATFYRMPLAKTCQGWHDKAPPGFTYSVKVSRFVTHIKRLKDCGEPMARFLERVTPLGETLGPLLYQLPPSFRRDDDVLGAFLDSLPRTLGPHPNPLPEGEGRDRRTHPNPPREGGKESELRHVFEFRHVSWYEEAVRELLDRHGAGFCVHDYSKVESPVARTGPIAYLRFHGTTRRYQGDYPDEDLKEWAEKMKKLGQGAGAVYAYFNNDVGGHAVRNAQTLRRLLGVGWAIP